MKLNEYRLLQIAIKIMVNNSHINPLLTGSLMLSARNIEKRRDAKDIDILVTDMNLINSIDGMEQKTPVYPDSVRYAIGDLHIDFLPYDTEKAETINNVLCCSVDGMLNAKYRYYIEDKIGTSSKKHYEDLSFMGFMFPEIPVTKNDNIIDDFTLVKIKLYDKW